MVGALVCACVCVCVRAIRRDWSTQEREARTDAQGRGSGGLARCPCAGSSGRPPQRGRAAGPRASTRCSPRGWPRGRALRLRTRPGGCAATGEFYAVPPDEARELRALQVVDPISYEPIPAGAARDDDDAHVPAALPGVGAEERRRQLPVPPLRCGGAVELGQEPRPRLRPPRPDAAAAQRLGGAARPVLERRRAPHACPVRVPPPDHLRAVAAGRAVRAAAAAAAAAA